MSKHYNLLLVMACALTITVNAQHTKTNHTKSQDDIAGTWTLVSVDNIYPDSSRVHPYGEHPSGLLMFDDYGNYALQILGEVRPRVASGDKNKATAEEYAALVKGSNSHFGQYTIDAKAGTITFVIAHASFPNWEGTTQKRTLSRDGASLKYVVTNTTQGGQSGIAEVVWRKIN